MEKYEVIIIGAGPAGLSAALYLSKAEMNTLVIGDDRSIMKSALLDDTYLGFPEPITGNDFMEIALKQVKNRDLPIMNEKVIEISDSPEGYLVKTEHNIYEAEQLILATGNSVTLAEQFGVETEDNEEPYIKKRIKSDDRCRTSKKNVYVAGIAAGRSSQAIIAAGHGAQVALNLISDLEEQRVCIHNSKK